jgi:hypothetical protein
MSGTDPRLRLSVYTIGVPTADAALTAIRDLTRQTARASIELIIVTLDRGSVEDHELDAFGAHQWVFVPEVRTSGEGMATAVRAARAPYVTYLEEHGTHDPAWAERLLAAFDAGYEVVTFAMANGNPESLTSWAHLYGQFGFVVEPVESRETDMVSGHHTAYRRDLLLEYGERLHEMLEDESALAMDLHARGVRMVIAGDALSYHLNLTKIVPLMKLDYRGMRSFAATRSHGWSWGRRLLYACGTPLVPLLRMRRSLAAVWRTGRQRQLMPGIVLPMALAMAAGGWGELAGYLLGRGRSAEDRVPVELTRRTMLGE